MYSVDNRRLAVFRLLEMTGHAKVVKAELQQDWVQRGNARMIATICMQDSRRNGMIALVRAAKSTK